MSTYDQGDVVRCTATITDTATGVVTDPTTVTFKFSGAGQTLTYIFGTDVALVKSSVGVYYVDVTIGTAGGTSAGTCTYRFEGGGTHVAAEEGTFVVRNSGIYG